MSPIEKKLRALVEEHGPISVSEFIEACLYDPEYGYYITRPAIGAEADFITAPEISQIFGELLGIWAITTWKQMGKPIPFDLIELGPGRGTLMADLLRAARSDEDFTKAVRVHLLESNYELVGQQRKKLSKYEAKWYTRFEELPQTGQFILIANEFLDALPIRQFVKKEDGWKERKIGLRDDTWCFYASDSADAEHIVPKRLQDEEAGTLFEHRPLAIQIVQDISERLERTKSAALFIDYGSEKTGTGDTLQAVHKHEHCRIFDHIGEADLTSHVDFETLIRAAGDLIPYLTSQGQFLVRLGLKARSDMLIESNPGEAETIRSAIDRLVNPKKMGTLFKVCVLQNKGLSVPLGFQ